MVAEYTKPSAQSKMNTQETTVVGLDVGGTTIKALALRYPQRETIAEIQISSEAKRGPIHVRTAIGEAIHTLQQQSQRVSHIGIGCAGSVNPATGSVRNSPNFVSWKNVPLKEWIQEDFQVPVTVHNDANCAVFSEWLMGNAKGCKNVILLTFGTGIGGGLILNDNLFTGATGTGGELGHFTIHADGLQCPCGNQGCFERYCSASALQEKVPGQTAKETLEQGGPVLTEFLHNLDVALTSLANAFDPDCILIGGAMAEGLKPHLPRMETWIKNHAFPSVREHVTIRTTQFGNSSGALGAALLALMDNSTAS